MKLTVTKRRLHDAEINILVRELRQFPHIGFINARLWCTFKHVYVASADGEFVGVCVVFPLKQWIKIGPLIIRQQYQGKRYGKALLAHVVDDLREKNLYIGSSNPRVHTIAAYLGFRKEIRFFKVPFEIQRYLLSYLFTRVSAEYLFDAMKKKFRSGHWKYYYFLKSL